MNKHKGCPKKQKDIQNMVLPSYEFFKLNIFSNFFWKIMIGDCSIMAQNAQNSIIPRHPLTKYSCPIAEIKKTKKLA